LKGKWKGWRGSEEVKEMEQEYTEDEQKRGFFSWLGSKFRKDEQGDEEIQEPTYSRRLFDGRIEKYLDHNLDSYISEYGIVTELDLQGYENRYDSLTGRAKKMKEFILDSDALVGQMEKELLEIDGKLKTGKK
jgi:hypothetical protein